MPEVQEAGPLLGQNFTDAVWRAIFGAEPSIVGDTNGSSYGITLPPASDSVELGSASIESRSVVGGFGHVIPAGTTQSLEIPASTNPTIGRTDLITVRLDQSSFTTAPGPVRVYRVPGVEGSADRPAYDGGPPGVEDMPLYAITRKQGQALTEAIIVDLRVRTGPHLYVAPGALMPTNVPLGSTATRGTIDYSRELVSGTATWVEKRRDRVVLAGSDVVQSPGEGFLRRDGSQLVRDGKSRDFTYTVWKGFPARNPNPAMDGALIVGKLHDQDKPISPDQVALSGWAIDEGGTTRAAMGYVAFNGDVIWSWASANTPFGADGRDKTLVLHGTWQVA
jgi:hypothetical protein